MWPLPDPHYQTGRFPYQARQEDYPILLGGTLSAFPGSAFLCPGSGDPSSPHLSPE